MTNFLTHFVLLFIVVGTHLGVSANSGIYGDSDAPRCLPTRLCGSMRYRWRRKRVLITLQLAPDCSVISTLLFYVSCQKLNRMVPGDRGTVVRFYFRNAFPPLIIRPFSPFMALRPSGVKVVLPCPLAPSTSTV